MARYVDTSGVALLRACEGCRLFTYDDATGRQVGAGDAIIGRVTAGYGHTGPDVVAGMAVTQPQAESWLAADLAACAADVGNRITVALNDNQFAALCVFRFNVGTAAFAASTLLRRLNLGDYECVPAELARWDRANGRIVPGLAERRRREAALFVTPVAQALS